MGSGQHRINVAHVFVASVSRPLGSWQHPLDVLGIITAVKQLEWSWSSMGLHSISFTNERKGTGGGIQ